MKKLLFATDGSDSSTKAAAMAEELLSLWTAAELTVLYVSPRIDPRFEMTWMVEEEYEYAERLREQVNEQFKNWGGRVEYKNVVGPPVTSICQTAEDEGAEMIIIGSHGRGAIDRMVLGSVSHGVLYRSRMPVLVVKG